VFLSDAPGDRPERRHQRGHAASPPRSDNPARATYVVIGSGAAGSVMAFELTRAGLDVTVVEAGRRQNPQTVEHSEVEMFIRSYKAGGLQATSDYHMLLVQGATVGGSTVINNAIWLEANLERVLSEWKARGAHVPEGEQCDSLSGSGRQPSRLARHPL
jgi:hypothetical protein